MNHVSVVFRKLSVRFARDDELVPCLTERQKFYIKWHATRTSRSVSYFLMSALLIARTKIGWQVTSCREIFEIGFPPLIPGKTTTLPANRATKEPRCGSFEATHSRNGKHRDRVPFFGSMENVSCRAELLQRLIGFPFVSGRRKECALVRQTLDTFVLRIYGIAQFHDHPGDRGDAEIWSRITRIPLL